MTTLLDGMMHFLYFLVVITPLVLVHELGHYLVARWSGVRIEVFSLGFGKELFGFNDRRGTRWRVSALPIGGYVKWFGDADPASTPAEDLDTMTPDQRRVSFHHKPLAARAAIVAAGPATNFLFTILIFACLYTIVGQPFTPAEIGSVSKGSAAEAAGLKPGDRILTVDGRQVARFEDLAQIIELNTGTPVHIVVRRGSADVPIVATPQVVTETDRFGNRQTIGMLGVGRNGLDYVRRDPVTAVWEACVDTGSLMRTTLTGVWQMAVGLRSADGLGGPLQIMKLSGDIAQNGAVSLILFMAVLSVNLGLINLFPIPILDGGHLLFYAAEALMGRPLGRRAQEIGFRLGLAFVLTLMVFATWNDLMRFHVLALLKGLVT